MNLEPLLRPRSIAVVGASERPSLGRWMLESLATIGFAGEVYRVNPNYDEVFGQRCYRALTDLPAAPDVVMICVGRRHTLAMIEKAAEAGARAAVIYDGGFAEADSAGRNDQLRLVDVCRAAGIALCGPNCMGILNTAHRSSTFLQPVRDLASLVGNVGLIGQSGSICGSMLADVRRFGFSTVVSSGNEAIVTAAAYIDDMIDDDATRVIAAFIETIRDADRFVAALDRAAEAGKPVVILKAGRSARARAAITSHTGGLAGESRVFSEVLRAHRAIEVSNLEDFTEVLAAFQSKTPIRGPRTQIVTTSGGQAELIIDLAEETGLELRPLPDHLRKAIGDKLAVEVPDGNPFDAWGPGDAGASIPAVLDLLVESREVDAILFSSGDSMDNQPLGRPGRELGYAQMLAEKSRSSPIPLYLLTTRPGVVHSGQVEVLKQAGAALLTGPRQALTAIEKIATWRMFERTPRSPRPCPPLRWDDERTIINEYDAKRLLAEAGLPTVDEEKVSNRTQALESALRIGYPVVLKAVADHIPHKSDLGLVALDLRGPDDLAKAFDRLETIVSGVAGGAVEYVVQAFVSGGVELFAGVIRDPDFGLMLACGRGGIDIEQENDVAFRTLPLAQGDASAMIAELRASRKLEASRGRPAGDTAGLIACLEALSDFAVANAAWIAEIDVNPIKVGYEGQGCRVVDALIVTRRFGAAIEPGPGG